jgi:Flp pilus assembly protein TadG
MMAIIWPGLLILTFMIVQAGLYYNAKQRAAAAADHGAAAAAANGGDIAAGYEAANAFLTNMPLGTGAGAPGVNVTREGNRMHVTVNGEIHPMVPIGTLTISATATAPIEQFVPEPNR